MSGRNSVCPICTLLVEPEQPRFYFPRVPRTHALCDVRGVVHLACVRRIDQERSVGASLANLCHAIADQSSDAPTVARDGNIVVRNRIHEQRLEICDYEDFCEISIPHRMIGRIAMAGAGDEIDLGMQALRMNDEDRIEIVNRSPRYLTGMPFLGRSRLLRLIQEWHPDDPSPTEGG